MKPCDEPVKQHYVRYMKSLWNQISVKNKKVVSFTFDAYERRLVAEIKVEQFWR